ncbi:hypothetical protein QOT17_018952 [Balamuthia mandrillaris]
MKRPAAKNSDGKHRPADTASATVPARTGHRRRAMTVVGQGTVQMELSDPRFVSTIHAVFQFAAGSALPPRSVVEERVRKVFLPHLRFRSRVILEKGRGYWEEVDNVDLSRHLFYSRLPLPGSPQTLDHLVETMLVRQMDFSRPVWEVHFLSGFFAGEGEEESFACVARIHHAIGDGNSLVRLLFQLLDPPSSPLSASSVSASSASSSSSSSSAAAAAAAVSASAPSTDKQRQQRPSPSSSALWLKLVFFPVELMDRGTELMCSLWTCLCLPLFPNDTPTRMKLTTPYHLSTTRRVACTKALPLTEFKRMKNEASSDSNTPNTTINDLLLVLLTGSIRRYLLAKKDPAVMLSTEEGGKRGGTDASILLRGFFPLDIRSFVGRRRLDSEMVELSNQWTVVPFSFPIHLSDRIEILRTCKQQADQLKRSTVPIILRYIQVVGRTLLSHHLMERLVMSLFSRFTMMMTNVIGPSVAMSLFGAKVHKMMFYVPAVVGSVFTFISYDGKVTLGLTGMFVLSIG